MTKKELIDAVYNCTEINRAEFEQGFNNLIEVVKETISKGETIYIRGFGTLKSVSKKAMIARNIQKNEAVVVPEHNIPVFKPSKEFKKQVNNN